MRNLKRVLSLAMASIMLLGLMVVGVGAKAEGYPDVTSDHHTEAIEVLQTVDIMSGDDDGNFEPDRQLKRDEMAVVMCNLLDLNVKQYGGTHPFTDVPEWAAPYVEACYTNGIIAGYSSTYFGAEDIVTTAQASLMLMKALGYFQYQRDFNDDWLLATVTQGSKIELYDDVDSNVRGAMTRNDVAQLVLNALESGMVEADVSSVLEYVSGDTSITSGATKYNFITKDGSDGYSTAISTETATSIGTNQDGYIVELGEKLFNGDLKKDDPWRDDFGRPAVQWNYKSDEIGTYAEKPILTSTKKVTKADMYSLIGKNNIQKLTLNTNNGKNDLNAYFNGDGTKLAASLSDLFIANNTEAIGVKSNWARSGLGVLTEVYRDSDNNIDVVVIPTYVAQASGDYNSASETLRTITLTGPGSFIVGTLNLEDWPEIKDIKDDDYILYTASVDANTSTTTLESIEVAQIVTGEVNAYSERAKSDGTAKDFGDAGGYVTIDGTQRNYALYASTSLDNGCGIDYTVGDTANVVVDKDGNVLYVDDASLSVGNFVYVDGIVNSDGFSGKHKANAYFADGTNKVITIDKMRDSSGGNVTIGNVGNTDLGNRDKIATSGNHQYDGWYSYSESSGGYTLRGTKTGAFTKTQSSQASKLVVDEDSLRFLSKADAGVLGSVTQIAANVAGEHVTSVADVRADDDTIFVVVEDDSGDDKVSIYSGSDNIPTVKTGPGTTNPIDTSDGVVVSWVNRQDKEGKNAGLVFIYADGEAKVSGGTTDTLIYSIKKDSTYTDKKNGDKIEKWVVVMNGELTTIDCKKGEGPDVAANGTGEHAAFESYRLNSDGYYEFDSNDEILFTAGSAHDLGGGNDSTFQAWLSADGKALSNAYVVCSGNTLTVGSTGNRTPIRVTSDTEITLITNKRSGTGCTLGDLGTKVGGSYICWTNADKDHEVQNGISAKGVESFLDGRFVSGSAFGIARSDDSETAERLYIVVTGVTKRADEI